VKRIPPVLLMRELQTSTMRCSKPFGIITWMRCGAPVGLEAPEAVPANWVSNGRKRRIFRLAVHPGEGRFIQPTAATQARRSELVFMPHCRPSHPSTGLADSGQERTNHTAQPKLSQ
jgi:hypothetical protein